MISVRSYPYPFAAMLSICSDLDETPSAREYFETSAFLNTTRNTPMGPGVGLEVGNTIYFNMPGDQFSYWNGSDQDRLQVAALARSGHVDCFHSFGDNATNRTDAHEALRTLEENGARIAVWIDHAQAITNFGFDIMQGRGDDMNSIAYHADLTIGHGVQYVWRGRVTSHFGQNIPYRISNVYCGSVAGGTIKTIAKDLVKQLLGTVGYRKYSMHAGNRLMRPILLRSGQPVWEFMRSNPHPKGVSAGETSAGIADILTDTWLNKLTHNGGVAIIYTHLGKELEPRTIFSARTVDAFRKLRQFQSERKILVCTTRRLLDYQRAREQVAYRHDVDSNVLEIDLPDGIRPDGLTFYFHGEAPEIRMNSGFQPELCVNPPDQSGKASMSFFWPALHYPL